VIDPALVLNRKTMRCRSRSKVRRAQRSVGVGPVERCASAFRDHRAGNSGSPNGFAKWRGEAETRAEAGRSGKSGRRELHKKTRSTGVTGKRVHAGPTGGAKRTKLPFRPHSKADRGPKTRWRLSQRVRGCRYVAAGVGLLKSILAGSNSVFRPYGFRDGRSHRS